MDAVAVVPPPVNEPALSYVPGSAEREELQGRLTTMAADLRAAVDAATVAAPSRQRMSYDDRAAVVTASEALA